jgi:ATP-dependent RNA helicase SUPV3L1/SUV3
MKLVAHGMAGTPLLALLGPTNTGKTHLAIETMGEHDDGVIGLPLRLLAREVYERLCARHGRSRCALVTGEEKIVPEGARYFACTVEAMPRVLPVKEGSRVVERPFSFVAVDEIQLCGDRERGHTFTDRLLHRRGSHKTMVMGSDTMTAPLRRLFGDDVLVERRPRLSMLSFTGPKKLSRLPKRSAVVAFSIADVYGIAEEVRHHHGGCAVVTGALSPATRNAQVAMFQAGEVDVLVATDAIGMGLNLDIDHVAFAETSKFDGDEVRALTEQELAQIAGRAGRHLKNGTFGTTRGLPTLSPDVVDRIERHAFPAQETLCWRQSELDTSSLPALLQSLRAPPPSEYFGFLVSGRPASDLLALERLLHHPFVRASVRRDDDVLAFFEHCQIPDFEKIAPDEHAGLVLEVWEMNTRGGVTDDWLRTRIRSLDKTEGDVDTLVARLARVRTLTYITHKAGWVKDAAHWQAATRQLEDRLSDALHERLTLRFVDRLRTVVKGGRIDAAVADDGRVTVAGEEIGTLAGLRFVAAADDDAGRASLRTAAAARGLAAHAKARADAILQADDGAFEVDVQRLTVRFEGHDVGRLQKGRSRLWPVCVPLTDGIVLDDGAWRAKLQEKLTAVARAFVEKSLPLVIALDPDALPTSARSLARALQDGLGVCDRTAVRDVAGDIDDDGRRALRRRRVRLGFKDAFVDDAFKDRSVRARAALLSVWRGEAQSPPLPPPGVSSFLIGDRPPGFVRALGFFVGDTPQGQRAFRADLVDDVFALLKAVPLPGPIPASALEKLGCSRDDIVAVLQHGGYDVDDAGQLQRRRRPPTTPRSRPARPA